MLVRTARNGRGICRSWFGMSALSTSSPEPTVKGTPKAARANGNFGMDSDTKGLVNLKKNKNKKSSPAKWYFVSGFSRFMTKEDLRSVTNLDSLNIDYVLDESMLPSGSLLVLLQPGQAQTVFKEYARNHTHVFEDITVKPVTDTSIYKTASKFGINESTVLLHNVPRSYSVEDINYLFEDVNLAGKGIKKLSSSSKRFTISFLMYCASRADAEFATIRQDGMSIGGHRLRMHHYSA